MQDGTDPDPYVKLYLLPDPQKSSKRKTKVARRTCNPTYNEMVAVTLPICSCDIYKPTNQGLPSGAELRRGLPGSHNTPRLSHMLEHQSVS